MKLGGPGQGQTSDKSPEWAEKAPGGSGEGLPGSAEGPVQAEESQHECVNTASVMLFISWGQYSRGDRKHAKGSKTGRG